MEAYLKMQFVDDIHMQFMSSVDCTVKLKSLEKLPIGKHWHFIIIIQLFSWSWWYTSVLSMIRPPPVAWDNRSLVFLAKPSFLFFMLHFVLFAVVQNFSNYSGSAQQTSFLQRIESWFEVNLFKILCSILGDYS